MNILVKTEERKTEALVMAPRHPKTCPLGTYNALHLGRKVFQDPVIYCMFIPSSMRIQIFMQATTNFLQVEHVS